MKNIMIIPERVNPAELFPIEAPRISSYRCHVLCKEKHLQCWEEALDCSQIVSLESPESLLKYWVSGALSENYDVVRREVTNDFMTYLLLERNWDGRFPFSFQNAAISLEKFIFAAVHYLSVFQIDELVYINSGEYLEKYILIRAAEVMKLQVSRIRPTVLPYRVTIDTAARSEGGPVPCQIRRDGKQSKELDFIKLNQGDYVNAIPENSRRKVDPQKKSFYRFLPGIKRELMPKKILGFIRSSPFSCFYEKRKIYKFYRTHSGQVSATDSYIVFFLHSQPEASTMPLGGRYAHQFTAIMQLSKAMPEGWTLYVKEHPSMFNEYRFDLRYRSLDFYRLLLELPNVQFLSLNTDNFQVIDQARYVATVTGTAGLQAICRGKNVIVFGDANYAAVDGVWSIDSAVDLQTVFEKSPVSCDRVIASVEKECIEATYSSFTTLSDIELNAKMINDNWHKKARHGKALSAYLYSVSN